VSCVPESLVSKTDYGRLGVMKSNYHVTDCLQRTVAMNPMAFTTLIKLKDGEEDVTVRF